MAMGPTLRLLGSLALIQRVKYITEGKEEEPYKTGILVSPTQRKEEEKGVET